MLFFAWLAHIIGAPELLGGFAAGLALSRRFFLPLGIALRGDPQFAHRIEAQMKPVIHLFTPIFFVMVGLSLNLREIDWGSGFMIGTAMIPRGEVGLVFAELGRVGHAFGPILRYSGRAVMIIGRFFQGRMTVHSAKDIRTQIFDLT